MDQTVKNGAQEFKHKWQILTAVMLGNIMGPLDGSIVNTVLPSITEFFHTDISIIQWVPTIYLVTISCLILLYGRLGDMIGYKKIFLSGLASFVVTSVLCGLSQNVWMLIVFRALQGLSAGMMMAVSFAIITSAFPPNERGKALGISAVAISVGLGLGPSLGGIIAENLSWRFVFFINAPIGITALFWCARILPESKIKAGQRLDFAGAAVSFVFLISILLFANRSEQWGWFSTGSVLLLSSAVVSCGIFLWIENVVEQPMLNLELFKNRVFTFANLSTLFSFMALFTLVFLTPFFLVFVMKYNMTRVGLVLASSPLATVFIAPLSGMLSDRIGTRGLAFSGMCICSIALFLLSRLDETAGTLQIIMHIIPIGLGTGMFQSPNNSTIMGNVPKSHLGITSGILASMRNVGMVFGIAVAGAVLYSASPVAAYKSPGSFDTIQMGDFLHGLQYAYKAGAVLAALSALTSLLAIKRK